MVRICEKCGRHYKIDLVVPHDLWLKIRLNKERPPEEGLICAICLITAIEETEQYGVYRLISRLPEKEKTSWVKKILKCC